MSNTTIIKRLALLSSGGDAPGMNAAIRAVVRTACANNIEVYGFMDGYQGLVNNDFIKMDRKSVANCIQRGGTILRTIRFPQFIDPAVRSKAIAVLQENNIDALVVLGGDGSFRGAKLLSDETGIKIIGIPCTIDNDIVGTEYTIGFDTARNTALEAIDKIRDTAFSHSRNFLVEVMGRSSGFLALDVGIAGGAEFIMVPEMQLTVDDLIAKISDRQRLKMGSIVVIAEADQPGHSFAIAAQIAEKLNIEYKVCVLGHIQRGGSPMVHDRKVASLMGYYAVKALLDGKSQLMVAYINEQYTLAPIPDVHLKSRRVDCAEIININNILCDS